MQRERADLSQILLVDDDHVSRSAILHSLKQRLERNSPGQPPLSFRDCCDSATAIRMVQEMPPTVVVLDLSLNSDIGPESGIALLQQILMIAPKTRACILTGHSDDHWGIRSLQAGAFSFLSKPVDPGHLYSIITDALATRALEEKLEAATQTAALNALGLRSRSESMREALQRASLAASGDQGVLILGETGTGKGILAQRIAHSGTRRGNFVRFQPAFGSFDLIASELFGHERGAFTGASEQRRGLLEEANRGTLFCDEIDELPQHTQISLLYALQEKRFRRVGSARELHSDFRIIAASNRSRQELQSRIRADLFHRIAHIIVHIPPLRERMEDLELLVDEFLLSSPTVSRLSPNARKKLRAYHWPGNIRELQAVIEVAAQSARFSGRLTIEERDICFNFEAQKQRVGSFRSQVAVFERELIKEAMRQADQNQSRAAEILQLDRSSLRRILERISRGEREQG